MVGGATFFQALAHQNSNRAAAVARLNPTPTAWHHHTVAANACGHRNGYEMIGERLPCFSSKSKVTAGVTSLGNGKS